MSQHHRSAHRHHRPSVGGPCIAAHEHSNPAEIAHYLTDLAEALRSGGVQIRMGERMVSLRLDEHMTLDLRAVTHANQTSAITLMLAWQVPDESAQPLAKLDISPLPPVGATNQSTPGAAEQSPDTEEMQPRPLPREDDTM